MNAPNLTALKLKLIVENTADLDGSSRSTAIFGRVGGTIGSHPTNSWVLKGRDRSIADFHVRVSYIDGCFCAEPLVNNGLRVNGSHGHVPQGTLFQLTDGDRLQIGRFTVGLFLSESHEEEDAQNDQFANRFAAMEQLISGELLNDTRADRSRYAAIDGNLWDDPPEAESSFHRRRREEALIQDPMELLDRNDKRSKERLDPLKAFDTEPDGAYSASLAALSEELNRRPDMDPAQGLRSAVDPQPHQAQFSPRTPVTPDFLDEQIQDHVNGLTERATPTHASSTDRWDSMTSSSNYSAIHDMDDDAFFPEQEANPAQRRGYRPQGRSNNGDVSARQDATPLRHDSMSQPLALDDADPAIDHVVLRPLLAGLGISAPDLTGPQADKFAREIGFALRTAVTRLIDVHQKQLGDRSSQAETQLHPIEDNPIRLGGDPRDVLQDLMLSDNPVHLNAAAAIDESLQSLCDHEEASRIASEEALSSVLIALSPDKLARRFAKYAKGQSSNDDQDGWNWQMYEHYYKELRSDRQKGFGRMFWEVFRQVYDREMRRISAERA